MSKRLQITSIPFVIGANFRSCSLSMRDRLFVEDQDIPVFLAGLKKLGILDAFILSTCDRIEVIGLHVRPDEIFYSILESLAFHGRLNISDLEKNTYQRVGLEAVTHIFSLASSLESQIIGETQVLGQIKACHWTARKSKMISGSLETLLQNAYRVAKRVRTETGVGEWSVSNLSVATHLAKTLFGDLSKVSAILIGVGNLGEIFAKDFQRNGIEHLTVYHPNIRRARSICEELGCNVIEQEELFPTLANTGIIICALGSREHILTTDIARRVLKKQKNKPIFILDLGIPGDVEPAVARISDAFVYDTKDLERLALEGKKNREDEASKARNIIDQEVQFYLDDQLERGATDIINTLRHYFEQTRLQVLEEQHDANRATELLINRLLDIPIRKLREYASTDKARFGKIEDFVQVLFGFGNKKDQ